MKKKKGLLDEIAEITGYLYLSDLHDPCKFEVIQKSIDMVQYGSHSDEEWQQAFFYITGYKIDDETEKAIRIRFKKFKVVSAGI